MDKPGYTPGPWNRYRCVEGRLWRHDPQHDDPDLETDVGQCPECNGKGCACLDCGGIGTVCLCCDQTIDDCDCGADQEPCPCPTCGGPSK